MKIWREKDKILNSWIWKADFWYRKKKYRPTAFNKDALEREIIRLKTEADNDARGVKVARVTLADCVKERVKDLDLSRQSHKQVKKILEIFDRLAGADKLLIEISSADFRAFINYLKEQNAEIAPQTINKYLGMISGCLSRAREYFAEMEDYQRPRVPWQKVSRRAKDRTISDGERTALLEYLRFEGKHFNKKMNRFEKDISRAARFEYADMFEIALLTAMRWGEVRLIEWTFIDFKNKIIALPSPVTKTGEARIVYLNSRAVEIFKEREKTKRSKYVFPAGGNPANSRKYYYGGIKRICEHLGLPFSREGFTLHTTRHTAVSEILDKTGNFAAAQAQAGHSDAYMTARYAHARRDKMLEVMETLVKD